MPLTCGDAELDAEQPDAVLHVVPNDVELHVVQPDEESSSEVRDAEMWRGDEVRAEEMWRDATCYTT